MCTRCLAWYPELGCITPRSCNLFLSMPRGDSPIAKDDPSSPSLMVPGTLVLYPSRILTPAIWNPVTGYRIYPVIGKTPLLCQVTPSFLPYQSRPLLQLAVPPSFVSFRALTAAKRNSSIWIGNIPLGPGHRLSVH